MHLKDEKGVLKRKLNSNDAYIYSPVQDKQNFLSSFSKKVISNLFNECGEDIAVAEFIDFIDNSNIKKSKGAKNAL